MGRNNKKRSLPTTVKTAAKPKKVPRVDKEASAEFWKSTPQWSFSHFDLWAETGGWIKICLDHPLDELVAHFRRWEKMTWAEILSGHSRTHNHWLDLSSCITGARDRLAFLKLDEYFDSLVSLRVNNTARVVGILDGTIFRILWWDPEHKICPSHQKHT